MAIDWNDKDLLQEAIDNSKSRAGVLRWLGYNPKSSISRRKLNKAIRYFDLDISNFTNRTDRWDVLPDIIQDCYNIGDVLRAVGLQDQGDNFKTAKRRIKELGLTTDHFVQKPSGTVSPYSNEDIFCENSKVVRSTARKRILKENLLPYKCSKCNITTWCGEEITLDLDHINGINNDHRIENLRFLCPNCHSLTKTHRGKKRGVG